MRYTWMLCIVLTFAVVGTQCHTAPTERGPGRQAEEKNAGRASRAKVLRSESPDAKARRDALECQICIGECLSWKVRRLLEWVRSVQYIPRAGGFACQMLDGDRVGVANLCSRNNGAGMLISAHVAARARKYLAIIVRQRVQRQRHRGLQQTA